MIKDTISLECSRKMLETQYSIRDTLFGNMSFHIWLSQCNKNTNDSWVPFITEKETQNRKEICIGELQKILDTPGLESRSYLQAWHFLRDFGIYPSTNIAKQLHGIIFEVNMKKGFDFLAIYGDESIRYYNFNGKSTILNHSEHSFNHLITSLLCFGRIVVEKIGLWNETSIPLPKEGRSRITMLTPGGLYFGEGTLDHLYNHALSKPLMIYGTELLEKLVQVTTPSL